MNVPAGWDASQGTLVRGLELTGRGLHTGLRVRVRVLPREANGICFQRVRNGEVLATLRASPALRRAQPLCTMLETADGMRVRTVEHLLAARSITRSSNWMPRRFRSSMAALNRGSTRSALAAAGRCRMQSASSACYAG